MAAAGQRSIRSVLTAAQQQKRLPITHKDDKHMAHGQLLLSVQQSPEPLERLLAVAKLSITLLTDLLRRSDDTQDIPLLVLGHHYISHRVLGEGSSAGATAGADTASGPAAATTGAAAQVFRAYLQELCTFDAEEGPKRFVGVEGVPLALLNLSLTPLAVAKAKRLGRDVSIKVHLASGGSSGQLQLLHWGEEYSFMWPSMQLLAPTNPSCPVAFKGEVAVSCSSTGLSITMHFSKDHTVSGTIDQAQPKPTAPATPVTGGTSEAPAMSSTTAGIPSGPAQLLGRPLSAPSRVQLVPLGSVSGSWMSTISVSCPKLGLEGILYDSTALRPAPVTSVDLRHLGPMRLSRVWSAIHDALLYADPGVASGGRAAAKLAVTMSQHLRALTLESASSRDVTTNSLTAAAPAGSSAAGSSSVTSAAAFGSRAAAAAGSSSSGLAARRVASLGAASSAGTDSDIEEFDRQIEGKGKDTEDRRAVPPCYKEQHAAGKKLKYMLHYTLTSLPSSAAAGS